MLGIRVNIEDVDRAREDSREGDQSKNEEETSGYSKLRVDHPMIHPHKVQLNNVSITRAT
ncbi:hypothetical protein IMY05_013G0096600 [Salix suchowensis]|nr:hypothetical protein IMY05_013G0096600 [Salix suchowensis]